MHFYRLDLQIKLWFCLSVLQYKPNISVYYCLNLKVDKSKMFSINIKFFLSVQAFF